MASNVKWIKLAVDIIDDGKMMLIESQKDGYMLELVWFKLLCLAGQCNNNGFITLTPDIPYTDEMISTKLRMELGTVQRALALFQQLKMIEIYDSAIMLSNWSVHQSQSSLEKLNEQNRERQRKYREKQKQAKIEQKENNVTSNVTHNVMNDVTSSYSNSISNSNSSSDSINTTSNLNPIGNREPISNNTIEPEATIELEGLNVAGRKHLKVNIPRVEADVIEPQKDGIDYQGIADMFNKTCVSYPRVTKMSNDRKKAIKARLNEYSMADIQDLFVKAERSDFLKGKNDRNWMANFDWLIKSSNMAKVLDGNYENRQSKQEGQGSILDKWFNA